MTAVACVAAEGHQLGESPVWCERRSRLYWVDTRGRTIHWLEPGPGRTGRIAMPELTGSIALVEEDDRLVAAMETGIFLVDPDGRVPLSLIAPVDHAAPHRFNDGRVDRAGRFWTGTMNDRERTPTGALYRLDAGSRLTRILSDVVVPNSLAWSPDSAIMYFADTYRHRIDAFPFDLATGGLGTPTVFAEVTGPGRPDGSAVDAEGFLWNAEYAGSRVVRYAPDGRIDRIVTMPVSNPTCCAFGGPGLATLFVTSAAQRLTSEQLAREPLAGGVFAVEPGVRGLPESRFRMTPQ